VKSVDEGRTFSEPIAIVDAASQKPGLTFQAADLAIEKGGRVYILMANNAWKLKLLEAEWGLYYTSLAPGADAFSPVRNLNRKPSEGFSLATDEHGAVTACFPFRKTFHDGIARQRSNLHSERRTQSGLESVRLLHNRSRLRRGRQVGSALPRRNR
jgi:hypothetical protein